MKPVGFYRIEACDEDGALLYSVSMTELEPAAMTEACQILEQALRQDGHAAPEEDQASAGA